MEITESQKNKMHHALGLNYKKKPFRNYYNGSIDSKDWNDLVEKGFAIKRILEEGRLSEGTCYYYVTSEGAKFLGVKLPED